MKRLSNESPAHDSSKAEIKCVYDNDLRLFLENGGYDLDGLMCVMCSELFPFPEISAITGRQGELVFICSSCFYAMEHNKND